MTGSHRPETADRPAAWPATGPAVVTAWAPWCGSCRAPASLVVARALAGIALVGAGLVAGSVALGLIGAIGLGWAAFGLVRR